MSAPGPFEVGDAYGPHRAAPQWAGPVVVRRGDDPANPGRDLGLAAFVLTWTVPLVGLVLAVVSRRRSEAAGFDRTDLTRWAFTWSIVSLCVTGLFVVGYLLLVGVAISSGLAAAG